MTQAQKTLFEKALAKAQHDGIYVVGKGIIKATGQQFYAVKSSSGDGCYTIIISGHSLICNCPAGQSGTYCKHRALVRQAMVEAAPNATAPDADKDMHAAPAPVLEERMREDDWFTDRAAAFPAQGNQGVHLYL